MIRRPPRSTRPDTLFPYTTLFRSVWSPDGRWIYYRALVDGKIAVWQAAADGSEARPVTSDPADIREFSLSADGQTLTYSLGATREDVIAAEQAEYDLGIRNDDRSEERCVGKECVSACRYRGSP